MKEETLELFKEFIFDIDWFKLPFSGTRFCVINGEKFFISYWHHSCYLDGRDFTESFGTQINLCVYNINQELIDMFVYKRYYNVFYKLIDRILERVEVK